MFPVTPISLPAGWTAYTDVNTSRTYYVHLPTGVTQWTRPPPPPPPPRLSPPPLRQPMVQNYPSSYTMTPTTPRSVQCQPQPQHYSSLNQATTSSGWNSERNYDSTFNQNNLLPPQALSNTYNPHWQSKRLRPLSYHDNTDFHQYNPPTKRPCVQHTTSALNKGNAESIIETRKRKCSKCGLMREWQFFSKRQWLTYECSRKCKACVDETEISQDTLTNEKDRTKVCSTLTNEKDQSRVCSSCGEHREFEAFSKRQWSCREEIRKCKTCMDKHLSQDCVPKVATKTDTEKLQSDQSFASDIMSAKVAALITEPNKNRTKVCSLCGEHRSWERFSKNQWTSHNDRRKCKSCVGKPRDCAEEVATNRDATESQFGQPVDKTIESAKEDEVSVDANNPGEGKSQAVHAAETESTSQGITASPDAIVSKESQNLMDDNPPNGEDAATPLKLCSKCNKELSKCSFTPTQWMRREGERRCNKCAIHPILKINGGSTKQAIIKQETDS